MIVPPSGQPLWTAQADRPIAIAPDASRFVYRASGNNGVNVELMVRAIDQLDARVLSLPGDPGFREPIVSADGTWVAFFVAGELRKASLVGGPAVTVARVGGAPRGASWGENDLIVFATSDVSRGLMTVPAAGGQLSVLTRPGVGEAAHVFPSFLPGATAVLFTIVTPGGPSDSSQVAVLDLKTGARKVLVRGGSQAEYVPSGHLVFAAAGALRAVPFDLGRLEIVGDAVTVVEHVLVATTGEASFAVSRTGSLLYVPAAGGDAEGQQNSAATPATLVLALNWGEELKRLAPRKIAAK